MRMASRRVVRRATALPGGSHTACHDTIADTLLSICEEAGLEVRAEPSTIFARAIPAVDLIAARGQSGIIPDASVVVSLPAALTTPSDRPSRLRLPERRLLWDVKTIHGDTSWYQTARARDQQCGAVEGRAQVVHQGYLAHARRLDRRFHAGRHPGLVEQIILDHGRVRGAAFGAYGEWSWDVEWLIEAAASTAAHRLWRRMGGRSESSARAILITSYRRRMGLTVVREMASHVIRQSQLAGLSREQLGQVTRERQIQRAGTARAVAGAMRAVEIAQELLPAALHHGGGF